MQQCGLRTTFALLAFEDGREAVPKAVASRSEVLSRLVGDQGSEASHTACVSGLPRHLLRAWALQHCRPANTGQEGSLRSVDGMVGLIQAYALDAARDVGGGVKAADFLADETCVAHSAAALYTCFLDTRMKPDDISDVLDRLADDLVLRILRQHNPPLMQLLSLLPPSHHPLGLVASCPAIEASKSLCVPPTEASTTLAALLAASSFTSVTNLSFCPWILPHEELPQVLEVLGSFQELRRLDISCRSLQGEGVADKAARSGGATLPTMPLPLRIAPSVCTALAGHFKFMPQLQSLKISDCGLQGAALTAIIQALPLLPALKVLSLQGSVFDPENASLFAHQFSKLDKLKVLNMAQAGLEPEEMLHILPQLPELKSLRTLDIRGNQHLSTQFSHVLSLAQRSCLPRFAELRTDHILDLSKNPSIQAPDQQFSQGLKMCGKYLRSLFLHVAQGAEALSMAPPEAAVECPQVVWLTQLELEFRTISECHLQRFSKEAAFQVLAALTSLQTLTVELSCQNYLSNSAEDPLVGSLSSLRQLTHLAWRDRRHVWPGASGGYSTGYTGAFATTLQALRGLRVLQLRCQFYGKPEEARGPLTALGDSIADLSHLQALHLSNAISPLSASLGARIALLPLTELLLDLQELQDNAASHGPPNALQFLPPIPSLQSLTFLGTGLRDVDVSLLAAFVRGAPKLTSIALHLTIASSKFPGKGEPRQEGRMHDALIELASAIAAVMNLADMRLSIDRWHKKATDTLFSNSPKWRGAHISIERDGADYLTVRNDSELHLLGVALSSATRLESLHVCHHCPPDSSFSRLLECGVSELPRLRYLFIGDLILTVENAVALGAALQRVQLPCLVALCIEIMMSLSQTQTPDRYMAQVPQDHYAVVKDAVGADGSQLLSIVERLPPMPSLERLTLIGDAVSKPKRVPHMTHAVRAVLRGSPRLRSVLLYYSDLQQQAVEMLAEDLGNLHMLVKLELYRVALGGGAARKLVQCMRGHHAFEELKVANCKLEKDAALALAELPNVVPHIRWLFFQEVEVSSPSVMEFEQTGRFAVRLGGCTCNGAPLQF